MNKTEISNIREPYDDKLFCDSCNKETNHMVLSEYASKANRLNNNLIYLEETLKSEKTDYFLIVECLGCNNVSFVHEELIGIPEEEEEKISFEYVLNQYPEVRDYLTDSDYRFLEDEVLDELPMMLRDLYFEVEGTFENNSSVLAGVGLRTLVEALCIHQKIPGRNLEQKIKNLNTAGLISNSEHPILDKLRLIGNISAHQIKSLPIEKLSHALDIINHVLKSIYFLPQINKKLKL